MYGLPLLQVLGYAPVWLLTNNPLANVTDMNTMFIYWILGSVSDNIVASTTSACLHINDMCLVGHQVLLGDV